MAVRNRVGVALLNNPGWQRLAPARPSSPTQVYTEDFSLLIRAPRRMRIKRGRIVVLS